VPYLVVRCGEVFHPSDTQDALMVGCEELDTLASVAHRVLDPNWAWDPAGPRFMSTTAPKTRGQIQDVWQIPQEALLFVIHFVPEV
jgi:hypothetical protein